MIARVQARANQNSYVNAACVPSDPGAVVVRPVFAVAASKFGADRPTFVIAVA